MDGNGSVDPVHAIHHHICYEVIEGILLREFKTALSAIHGCGLEAADVEHQRECIRIGRIVIDDKDCGPDDLQLRPHGGNFERWHS